MHQMFSSHRFIHVEVTKISEIDDVAMKNLNMISGNSDLKGLMHLTFCLLEKIKQQVKMAYDDILFAALRRPVFGKFLACCSIKGTVARNFYPD